MPPRKQVPTQSQIGVKPIRATVAEQTSFPSSSGRKPWKKKTPIDVVRDQIDRLRTEVEDKESELALLKRQLQKLEEVTKVLDGA